MIQVVTLFVIHEEAVVVTVIVVCVAVVVVVVLAHAVHCRVSINMLINYNALQTRPDNVFKLLLVVEMYLVAVFRSHQHRGKTECRVLEPRAVALNHR